VTRLAVVIPARDEEDWLPATLRSVRAAADGREVEIVVVDNASRDGTAAVARDHGARVVSEPAGSVGRLRNAGARATSAGVLVFLDADTTIPPAFLARVEAVLADPSVLAGGPVVEHVVTGRLVRRYLDAWAALARSRGMVQGSGQFVRRAAFDAVGGFDERIYMGEDVDLFWRLGRHAEAHGARIAVLDDVVLRPSPRRYEAWPAWRTLVFTNPLVIRAFMRRRWFWRGWYGRAPR